MSHIILAALAALFGAAFLYLFLRANPRKAKKLNRVVNAAER
jgi:hypothetical protein